MATQVSGIVEVFRQFQQLKGLTRTGAEEKDKARTGAKEKDKGFKDQGLMKSVREDRG